MSENKIRECCPSLDRSDTPHTLICATRTAPSLKLRDGDQPLPERNGETDIQSLVIADIQGRREVGITRYGTALQPFNGRDALRDAYEEAMDLTMYLKQAMVERDKGK